MAGLHDYSIALLAIIGVVLLQFTRVSAASQMGSKKEFVDIQQIVISGLRNPLRHVPGPWHTRFSNLSLKAATLAGRRIHHVHALHQQYGPYVRISPTEVAVADAAGFKRIHALGSGFNKTQWYSDMASMEREGVFSMQGGKLHADRRRLLSRPFSKSHLRQIWEPTIREHVCLAVEKMIQESQPPGSADGRIDVLKWWTFMASDVSAHLMFGESFHTLDNGVVSDYIRILQNTLKGGGIGYELPWIRAVCKRMPLPLFKEIFDGTTFLMNYGRAAVTNMKSSGGGGNIFANMMKEAEKGENLDEKDVQVEATNLIVAGTDTTAITLTYLVWAVLSQPSLRDELVVEVQSLPDGYSDTQLEALPLLNAVIEETLRLYGAAPGGLPRLVPVGGVEMGGLHFPGGAILTTQSYSFHRDPSIFRNPYRYVPGSSSQPPANVATASSRTASSKAAITTSQTQPELFTRPSELARGLA